MLVHHFVFGIMESTGMVFYADATSYQGFLVAVRRRFGFAFAPPAIVVRLPDGVYAGMLSFAFGAVGRCVIEVCVEV